MSCPAWSLFAAKPAAVVRTSPKTGRLSHGWSASPYSQAMAAGQRLAAAP